jgi:hypothetical protein
MTKRDPVQTAAELDQLDHSEIVEGYHDGLAGDDEPGDNRSKSYWHGWRNGNNDRNSKSDAAQRALVRSVKAARR